MKKWIAAGLLVFLGFHVSADDLLLLPGDLRIEQTIEGGYYLWVKKKENLGSILLTESTADPAKRSHSYTLRSPSWNKYNGDELRLLNGKTLDKKSGIFSLLDSTPEPDEVFGRAFRIFIPYIVNYGYDYARHGEIQVLDGTWLNVRTFEKPLADYSGRYTDNPFVLRVVQKTSELPEKKIAPVVKEPPAVKPTVAKPPARAPEETPAITELPPAVKPPVVKPPAPEPEAVYMEDTVNNFREIAEEGGGTSTMSLGRDDLLAEIGEIVDSAEGASLDIVLALDTTQSMADDIPYLRNSLVPMLKKNIDKFRSFRLGMVLYKDYLEQYVTKVVPFGKSLEDVQEELNNIRVSGGRDIPEAVYEALYAGIHSFPWTSEARLIILVGDAPPHPRPRGTVTRDMVYTDAELGGIKLHTIIIPQ
ncbi:MAG: VWA domain-containing protein [Spirochaetales bacterium]|nr:MAG: VWA domain-containing protein [Spirochaetales bacterium]